MFAATLLIAVDRHQTHLNRVRDALSLAVAPLQYFVSMPIKISYQMAESLTSYENLMVENQRLRDERLIYKAQLLRFSALEQENMRLRALLEGSYKLGEQVLVAELLAVNLAPYKHIILVNKGSRFGVYTGQPVLDANGVVGQVVRANPFNAEVMLLTDPNHAIPVQINRNGLRTIAVGGGQLNQLSLPFLPNNADIQVGDLLVTSGLGQAFPPGYPVATVTKIAQQHDKPFAAISAKPSAELNRSRELLLVWTQSTPIPFLSKVKNIYDEDLNQGSDQLQIH